MTNICQGPGLEKRGTDADKSSKIDSQFINEGQKNCHPLCPPDIANTTSVNDFVERILDNPFSTGLLQARNNIADRLFVNDDFDGDPV